jgi:hypothetical protein
MPLLFWLPYIFVSAMFDLAAQPCPVTARTPRKELRG